MLALVGVVAITLCCAWVGAARSGRRVQRLDRGLCQQLVPGGIGKATVREAWRVDLFRCWPRHLCGRPPCQAWRQAASPCALGGTGAGGCHRNGPHRPETAGDDRARCAAIGRCFNRCRLRSRTVSADRTPRTRVLLRYLRPHLAAIRSGGRVVGSRGRPLSLTWSRRWRVCSWRAN